MEENTNVQFEVSQDTTPDTEENGTQQAEAENTGTDTETQDSETGAGTAARAEGEEDAGGTSAESTNEPPPPFITVRYNHEDRGLSQDEAITLAQKGLHYDTLHGKLDYVASLQGIDVNTLVERLVTAPEEAHKKHLEELYGEDSDDVKIGMNIFREKQSENYKKFVADREKAAQEKAENEQKTTQSRLAEEFIELQREFPDVAEFKDLPDSVIREAAGGKRDLISCYLKYLHTENKRIKAAEDTAAAALISSAGSMSSAGGEISNEERQFLDGIWGR